MLAKKSLVFLSYFFFHWTNHSHFMPGLEPGRLIHLLTESPAAKEQV